MIAPYRTLLFVPGLLTDWVGMHDAEFDALQASGVVRQSAPTQT